MKLAKFIAAIIACAAYLSAAFASDQPQQPPAATEQSAPVAKVTDSTVAAQMIYDHVLARHNGDPKGVCVPLQELRGAITKAVMDSMDVLIKEGKIDDGMFFRGRAGNAAGERLSKPCMS
jgi:hypothetical protein